MESIIELKNVCYKYPNGPKALDNVSLKINAGEKIALVGPNGAGKSTLLLMFNGMLKPDSGEILFNGEKVTYNKEALRELRRRVGFVFQNPDVQTIAPTVFQDVAFGPVNLGMSREEVRSVVLDALSDTGLTGFERRPIHQLSGGEKKRAAMAGILAMDPDVLVFDEPTSALDPAGSEDIMELLDEMQINGKTIIISTHDVELAYPWADRVLLIKGGNLILEGKPEDVFYNKNLVKSCKLSMPVLLELYEGLAEKGMPSIDTLPKSALDFITYLCENCGLQKMKKNTPISGDIYLADAEHVSPEIVKDLLGSGRIAAVGAMGTKAKAFAGNENISLEFTYGVIDKCVLKAINKKNTLILSSGGMFDRVRTRVETFNQEYDQSIRIIENF
jgi:cobalt/nickel transport system ATP-binding protein